MIYRKILAEAQNPFHLFSRKLCRSNNRLTQSINQGSGFRKRLYSIPLTVLIVFLVVLVSFIHVYMVTSGFIVGVDFKYFSKNRYLTFCFAKLILALTMEVSSSRSFG